MWCVRADAIAGESCRVESIEGKGDRGGVRGVSCVLVIVFAQHRAAVSVAVAADVVVCHRCCTYVLRSMYLWHKIFTMQQLRCWRRRFLMLLFFVQQTKGRVDWV